MHQGIGRLTYGQRWISVNVGYDLIRYYRFVVVRQTGLVIDVPKHKGHITVVAGKYESPKKELWGKYEGEKIAFWYGPKIEIWKLKKTYYWLTVRSGRLERIREELGLRPKARLPFHLTIGNLKNE